MIYNCTSWIKQSYLNKTRKFRTQKNKIKILIMLYLLQNVLQRNSQFKIMKKIVSIIVYSKSFYYVQLTRPLSKI